MNADFLLCDVCGERVPKEHRFRIVTDRSFDGVENVNEGRYVDLCATHAIDILHRMCGIGLGLIPNYEAGKQAIGHLEHLQKKHGKK